MNVLGIMSGTSADGIELALASISGAPPRISAKFEAHHHVPFPKHVREAILRLANGAATTTAEIGNLSFLLGEEFAAAAIAACKSWRVPLKRISLIGSHGQTVFHQGAPVAFLDGRRVASTMQIGESGVIAERTGIPTIADFRLADIAAGGQGAPLVPFVDYLLFRAARHGRVVLNIGGIANITVIPKGARREDVFAFDTGPGNMIVDALKSHFTRGRARYDRDARFALSGKLIPALLAKLMRDTYLQQKPPKTAGREQFGQDYAENVLSWGRKHRAKPQDLVHTATVFTSITIADALRRYVFPRVRVDELIASGGGVNNPLMMAQLAAMLPGTEIATSGDYGVPSEAKEAFAFAILAYEAFHRRANNLPSATGARHSAILGKLAFPR
jgi:anhydro-N-acetylmuramic acid kinase